MQSELPTLIDYQKWQQANYNINFSLYDYIHGLTIQKALPIDFYIACLKLFYPEFILINNCIFLKEQVVKTIAMKLIVCIIWFFFGMTFIILLPRLMKEGYDANERLVAQTAPENGTISYTYDPQDNLLIFPDLKETTQKTQSQNSQEL
jgi:YD repeat-containing protein